MKKGRVSVIIPLYNKQEYIARAIESVLVQDYNDFEVIVVNDGSTDDSFSRAAKYRDRITLLSQKNTGVSTARNNGIKLATGEFFFPLDADDWVEKDYLSKTVLKMVDERVGAVATDVWFEGVPREHLLTPEIDLKQELIRNWLPGHSLYRIAAFLQTPGYVTETEVYEDWNFWIDILKRGWTIAYVHEPLVHYQVLQSDESASKKSTGREEEFYSKIKKQHPDLWEKQ